MAGITYVIDWPGSMSSPLNSVSTMPTSCRRVSLFVNSMQKSSPAGAGVGSGSNWGHATAVGWRLTGGERLDEGVIVGTLLRVDREHHLRVPRAAELGALAGVRADLGDRERQLVRPA